MVWLYILYAVLRLTQNDMNQSKSGFIHILFFLLICSLILIRIGVDFFWSIADELDNGIATFYEFFHSNEK